MKKLKSIAILLSFCLLLSSGSVMATSYTRPNGFMSAKGQEKIHQIKKFQALNNLTVTGGLNNETTNILHDPTVGPVDRIDKAPSNGYWIAVNKSRRILTVYKGKKVALKFPVAIGTKYTPTPSTKAKISNMAKNPAWGGMGGKYKVRSADDPLNPLGERWMGLSIPDMDGYGIHGTIKPNEIGTNASNGCIRMFNYDIENFVFPIMNPSDPVWIGSTEELKSWGLSQGIEKIKKEEPVKEKPVEARENNKPTEKEQKPSSPKKDYKGVDLLEF